MNKQELIKKYEEYENGLFDIGARAACQLFLKDLEQLDEPEKVKVPQCVAEIIEYYKRHNATLYDALREKNFNKQYNEWLMNEQDAYNKVARAWLDGYEVDKEKRYTVVMKETKQPLYYNAGDKKIFFSLGGLATNFTQKQLEAAGFGWVFDCEGVEVKELEDE